MTSSMNLTLPPMLRGKSLLQMSKHLLSGGGVGRRVVRIRGPQRRRHHLHLRLNRPRQWFPGRGGGRQRRRKMTPAQTSHCPNGNGDVPRKIPNPRLAMGQPAGMQQSQVRRRNEGDHRRRQRSSHRVPPRPQPPFLVVELGISS